ncbi:DUF2924 domain-containing protein [Limnoglobus roseus]|uniref:DUF2924 domain-containing protein n=1 Tax=Limnoglobus roseus TaxID=2598579 RepID=A0A5C1APZ4_9BACT|nr:DUF2924 domain-containing protein [Limnoglobus roseus]QEL20675.1 hypothetical protein PX52LOC_07782 [Limnoglobus roseus]
MDAALKKAIAELPRLTVLQLRAKYAEAHGEPTRAANKGWLVRRIAWRLQANAAGGLTERALRRAAELANDADLRLNPPRGRAAASDAAEPVVRTLPFAADARLPPPGTILTRAYKGTVVRVQVLTAGFEYDGEAYPSLSAVAKAVTGSHVNGFHFFRLGPKGTP